MKTTLTPKSNNQLFGHDEELALLKSTFTNEKISNAWLVCGPKGIGKATLAYNFCKSLFINDKNNLTNLTKRIVSNSFPDLLVIEKSEDKKEISVEEIRKVGHFFQLFPAESNYRAIIIDSIDDLSINAANALLKYLEEPPSNAFFLLISHLPARLLPTIKSRVKKLNLKPLNNHDALSVVKILEPNINETEALKLLSISKNSPGLAVDLYKNNFEEIYNKTINLLNEPQADIIKINKFATELTQKENKNNWLIFVFAINYLIENIIKSQNIDTNRIYSEEIIKLSTKTVIDNWLNLWDKIQSLFQETEKANLDKKQVIMSVFDIIFEPINKLNLIEE